MTTEAAKSKLRDDSDDDQVMEDAVPLRAKRRPKRIIEEDSEEDSNSSSSSSSSDDEDTVPLNQRSRVKEQKRLQTVRVQIKVPQQGEKAKAPPVKKKVKLTRDRDQVPTKATDSTTPNKKVFDLTGRSQERKALEATQAAATVQFDKPTKAPRLPTRTISDQTLLAQLKIGKTATNNVNGNSSARIESDFKAPLPPSVTKSLKFRTPIPPSTKANSTGFKTSSSPIPTTRTDNFKAPLPLSKTTEPNNFKTPLPPSSKQFKAPLPPTAAPSNNNDTFGAPMPSFKAPSNVSVVNDTPGTDLMSSRLNHYISMICADLDMYNKDKVKQTDSLLNFNNNDDMPMLDISVMRKFTSLTHNIIKRHESLDPIENMEKFTKVIKLMEHTVTMATEMDVLDHYSKNPQENKNTTLAMVRTIGEALEACCMIFELLILVDSSNSSNGDVKSSKRLLSRDLVTSCFHLIKNQLDFTIYPIIDLSLFTYEADEDLFTTTQAYQFVKFISSSPPVYKNTIISYLPNIIRFFRQAYALIQKEELDDDVLVIIAYISMAPFFHEHVDSATSRSTPSSILFNEETQLGPNTDHTTFNPYEQLRYCALDILKNIFSRYPKQRKWIFEEILTSIGSLTTIIESDKQRRYRLRDNRSIHITSALFMQLVQCCASITDVTSHQNWFKRWTIKYQKATKSQNEDQIKLLHDKLTQRAADAWKASAEAAASSASFFLEFLLSKCKSRKKDSISVLEYRGILNQTLEDIMTVLNDPEWPVAELIIRVFSRLLMALLEENTNDHFLKSTAIEWLGTIASKIKVDYNRLSGAAKTYVPDWVCALNEVLPTKWDMETPIQSIALVDQCRKKLLDYVMEENANNSIVQFYMCNWGFMESVVWKKANKGWEIETKKVTTAVKEQLSAKADHREIEPTRATDRTTNDPLASEDIPTAESAVSIDTEIDVLLGKHSNNANDEEPKWPKDTVMLLGDTCKYYWLRCLKIDCQPFPPSKFCTPSHDQLLSDMNSRSDYNLLCELLASRQTLYTSLHYILSELLTCLEKEGVVYRSKSLKAFEKLATAVPEIMNDTRIRTAVLHRVHDSSPSVRDAALKVIARYLVQLDYDEESVVLLHKLYNVVSGRVIDTAAPVRKRIVRLLAELYSKFTDDDIKTDIASKLILRMNDDELSVTQLLLKSTQKILFEPFREMEKKRSSKDIEDYFGYSYANSPKSRKQKITQLTSIITGAVSRLDPTITGQNAALSQIIQKTLEGADEKEMLFYDKVFQWIVDCLFDRMIKLEEEDNTEEFINCLATVYSFTKSCPHMLRESHISMLQPYLTVTANSDWMKANYILAIYRDVLPNMKYHDPRFIQSVERMLMQLLGRCPLGLIPDGVSCLCTIVDSISYHYDILIKMLGSCITKLRGLRGLIENGQESDASYAGVLKMLLICGLLCQHFEFDKRRVEYPEKLKSLDSIYKGSINNLVFDTLQFFTSESMDNLATTASAGTETEHENRGMTLRMTALQGLGYLFASYPTFMISPASTELMDNIFAMSSSSSVEEDKSTAIKLQIQLMHVYQEFLAAEEKRLDKKEALNGEALAAKGKHLIDIDTLLGNTEEYAELGVNGSSMQRYLKKILKCALSADSEQLRYAAFEVVSSIIHQGLAHPVLCMPAIVAAETSMDLTLRMKAYYLHKYAHDKYGQLLYIQLSEYLSTSYAYQKIIFGEDVRGYSRGRGGDAKVEAVLGLTYSVLKEKKKPRLDFLSGLIKPFEFDIKTTSVDEVDIGYLKYLAENAISLDLGATDEVLTMVHIIDRILITTGADLLSYIQYLKRKGILDESILDDAVEANDESSAKVDDDTALTFKLAVAMCILLYTKNLLVELYDIPDDEIRDFNPNTAMKRKARDVTRDLEMDQFINWDKLIYFQKSQLSKQAGLDACINFEQLLMNDTTTNIDTMDDS